MRRLLKLAGRIALLGVALVVLAAGVLLSWRAFRQHANAKALAISSADGINESGFVEIGGIRQWIQIRGRHRTNPVLLCVHGGPGGTWIPVTRLFVPWEEDFTVVLWDERGAGKTLASTGPSIAPTMSIERMAQDGIEVAEHLCQRLGQEKIILLGHSFGSILGVRMIQRRPELFHAFVGTGQVGDLPRSTTLEFDRLRREAGAANDAKTLDGLARIGEPPFENLKEAGAYFRLAEKYQPASDTAAMLALQRSLLSPVPGYSLGDELNRIKGFMSVPTWTLYEAILGTRLADAGTEFRIPVFIFQGTLDRVTPLELAEEYLATVRAPQKELVRIDGGGHFAVWSHAEIFRQQLLRLVRPIAERAARG